MNMLEKYIIEVGKHLPRKNRLDLQNEIRSTLEDMLEDRSRQTNRPVNDTLISEVLKEYGAPAKVAAAYQTIQYLVGPRLFPFFIMVVKIVVAVLFAVALGGFAINIISNNVTGVEFFPALGKFGLQFLGSAIAAFGNIVIVFAILERVLPASEFEDEEEKWDPSDLDAEPDPHQIKNSELIVEILITILGLALLNLYPHLIGIGMVKDNTFVYMPVLSDAFHLYLPWINLLGVIQILFDGYLLSRGVWHMLTRFFGLVIEVAGIALAVVMLTGPSLVKFSAADLANTSLAESAEVLGPMINFLPLMVLVIVIIVNSIEVIQAILHMVRWKSVSKPYPPRL